MAPKKSFKSNAVENFLSDLPQEETETHVEPTRKKIPEKYLVPREYKSERMQLLVRPTTKKALKELAEENGISVNELINIIFEEYLEG